MQDPKDALQAVLSWREKEERKKDLLNKSEGREDP